MKVTEAMYGRAAKCVSCHQKWFVPKQDEITPGSAEIHLQDHPELLRRPGVFVRSQPLAAQVREPEAPDDAAHDPPPLLVSDEEGDEKEKIEASQYLDKIREGHDDALGGAVEGNSCEGECISDREGRAHIRNREKKPFDTLESLRLLCCYERALENLEHRILANEEPAVDDNLLGAYQRSLTKVRQRITEQLKKQHESVSRQLGGLEKEIDRLAVSLRLGEIDLSDFLSQTASLRNTRECLARYDHHLQAWQHVQDPFLAGGLSETALDSFDDASFGEELSAPGQISDDQPLFVYYSDELRRAMHTRSGMELRLEEWKRLAAERPVAPSSFENGMAESSAARERAESAIAFFRRRLQVLLTDCSHDLESLDKYRRDVLDRDRKGQIKRHSKEILLNEIESAESGLIRIQAHIQKTLHANAEIEVPVPSTTLAERFSGKQDTDLRVYAAAAFGVATLFTLGALLLLSYRETGRIHRMMLLPICFLLLHPCALLFREGLSRKTAVFFGWILQCGVIIATLVMLFKHTPIHPGRFLLPHIDVLGLFLVLGSSCSGLAVGISLIDGVRFLKKAEVLVPLLAAVLGMLVMGVFYIQAQSVPGTKGKEPVVKDQRVVPPPLPQSPASLPVDRETVLPTPDPAAAEIQDLSLQDASEIQQPIPVSELPLETGAETVTEGEASRESEAGTGIHSVSLCLIGVVHGEGISPRFRATAQYYDGRQETLSIQLGDAIAGDWKAVEYNSEDKKLTVTNGKRMLLLGAGDTVVIDDVIPAEGEA